MVNKLTLVRRLNKPVSHKDTIKKKKKSPIVSPCIIHLLSVSLRYLQPPQPIILITGCQSDAFVTHLLKSVAGSGFYLDRKNTHYCHNRIAHWFAPVSWGKWLITNRAISALQVFMTQYPEL